MYKLMIRFESETNAVSMAKQIEKAFPSVEGEVKLYKETDVELPFKSTYGERVRPTLNADGKK